MAFANYHELADAENAGKVQVTGWRKKPTQATSSGVWFDLAMSSGYPGPCYYAASPNIAVRLAQSTDTGIYHGNYTGQKYLKQLLVMADAANAAPMPMILCDYLLFYPFVDMRTTDAQPLDNTVKLGRYTDGRGVQIMAVQAAGQSGVGNPQFQITYTNQDGNTATTPTVACGAATYNGAVITSAPNTRFTAGPFIPLAAGDTGVRDIQSIQFLTPDVGLITLVLIKPIAQTAMREQTAPVERDYAIDFTSMPSIAPDAYLNFLCHPVSSISGVTIFGTATFIWS